jgi:hypothetical protein
METTITEEDGVFTVQVRRAFKTMDEAQSFAASVHCEKVDRRKLRPRAFDEFCEYTPESTSTHKRAKCKICVKLHGHVAGVTESTFTLEWVVGETHQGDVRERENNEASRHLRTKVKTDEGFKRVDELHQMYKENPSKYAVAAPPPPHEPVMKSFDEAFSLEENIEAGETLAHEVARLAKATAYAVIAMQDPVGDAPVHGVGLYYHGVDLQKRAETVMSKDGVQVLSSEYTQSKYNLAKIEAYLCKLPRSEPVDLAIEVLQRWWYRGVKKATRNNEYLPRMLACFKAARSAHEEVMAAVRIAFAGLVEAPWEPKDSTRLLLAMVEREESSA